MEETEGKGACRGQRLRKQTSSAFVPLTFLECFLIAVDVTMAPISGGHEMGRRAAN